jgi:hypothetical protein
MSETGRKGDWFVPGGITREPNGGDLANFFEHDPVYHEVL